MRKIVITLLITLLFANNAFSKPDLANCEEKFKSEFAENNANWKRISLIGGSVVIGMVALSYVYKPAWFIASFPLILGIDNRQKRFEILERKVSCNAQINTYLSL